ncbi:tetraspanin-33-like [Oratosquilla oratoria]|uniref:tetraspanin-33-like n=1 Tax=Oratosquilla oratoria TaxID=337810 RepID=UPI003F768366
MSRRRNSSYVSSCVKWSLFIFNFVFWLFGLLVMAIGAYGMYFTAEELQGKEALEIAYTVVTDVSCVLVALGAIIFLVSFAGCIGALRENLCLLRTYVGCLTIFLILELLVAISCIVFPWKSREILEHMMSNGLVKDYWENANTKDMVDFLQSEFQCCGVTHEGFLDWNHNEYFNCSDSNKSQKKCGVPPSCCRDFRTSRSDLMCGFGLQKKKKYDADELIYTTGCVTAIKNFLESNLYVAAGILFGITLFQMYVTHQARTLTDQIMLQRARCLNMPWENEAQQLLELRPQPRLYR